MPATTTGDLTNTYQRYFSKELLKHALQLLVMAQFAQRGDLPRNRGVKSVRYFRKVEASTTDVVELAEGVTPSERRKVTFEEVDVDLKQYGEVATITDIVGMTALFNMLKEHIATMGEDAALHADDLIRNVVIAGLDPTDGTVPSGSVRFSQGLTAQEFIDNTAVEDAKLVRADGLKAVTQLKLNRAPKFGGYYVGVIPPQISQDLMQDEDWIRASHYGKPEQLFQGEVGKLDGARYVEHTNPHIANVQGPTPTDTDWNLHAPDGDGITTKFLGKGAYGAPKLAGSGTPWKPQVLITPDQASDSDPLNQRRSVGWKVFWNSVLLNPKYVVRMISKTTFN